MEVRAEFAKFYDVEADALVVTIYQGEKADEGALKELDERTGGIVSEMLGHASTSITDDIYAHVTPTMQRAVTNVIDAAFGGR